MSSDKRSVSTDALETLGTIITGVEGCGRDAIHLAVEPVIAGNNLHAGDDVGFLPDGTVGYVLPGKLLGIVDPFVKKEIKKGERFWLVVYPRQITSLRHVWSHPSFPEAEVLGVEKQDTAKVEQAEAFLRAWVETLDITYFDYERLLELVNTGAVLLKSRLSTAYDWQDHYSMSLEDGYIRVSGTDAYGSMTDEVWDNLEIVTGKKFDERAVHFSCSC